MRKLLAIALILSGMVLSGPLFAAEMVTEEWVARYNGTGNGQDIAEAIALDTSGNIYVTGQSYGSGTGANYATVKYDSAGVQQWVATYDNGSTDVAVAIAIGPFGNVYVTGYSYNSGTHYDYATVKYDSAGVQQWVARYDGPANYRDDAYAIAVDSSGYIYVTGTSVDGTHVDHTDYATVKYSSEYNDADFDGYQDYIWVARYNGLGNSKDVANAIATYQDTSDPDNVKDYIYVTGISFSSGTKYDYVTIKYSSEYNGEDPDDYQDHIWVARYDDPANYYDYAYAIAVDSSGYIYVTGQSYGSCTHYDYATVKYDSAGVQQWVARYDGPVNSRDAAYAIAVDSEDNIYVTGYSVGSGTYYDYATVKYDPTGNEVWVKRYNGPGNSYDQANAVSLDASGSVYVTGYSYGDGTLQDYATVKYDPDGNEIWVQRYNGPVGSIDKSHAVAVDPSGNVYITGQSYGSGTNYDYVTIKYAQPVPTEAIKSLIAYVISLNLKQGIENSLDAKLDNALRALEAANAGLRQDAANKILAFINEIEAQRDKALTNEQANTLLEKASDILLMLS